MSKWEMVKLGDVCTINMGQSPDSSSYNEVKDGLPFYQGNADFGVINPVARYWCNKPTKIAEKNDILFSVRAPIGAINVALETCCIGRGLSAIRPNTQICNDSFIRYTLLSSRDNIISQGTGSTFKAINKSVLSGLEIPLPPLETQKKIADELDKITGLIEKRKSQIEKLDLLTKAKFVEMFGDPRKSNLHKYIAIKEIASVISGGTPSREIEDYWNGEIKWVKTTELKNAKIYNTIEKITKHGLDNSSAKICPVNTILIAMYGQGKTRGMTALLRSEASTNQACACILPSDKYNSDYLWNYLMLCYSDLRNLAKGGNQPNLNGNMIKDYCVLYPPLDLQNKFAQYVEKIEKTRYNMEKGLEQLEVLYKERMQEYFG